MNSKLICKTKKIFLAGHTGLVGQGFMRRFVAEGQQALILRSHKQVNLANQTEAESIFKDEVPDRVIIAAGKVGGIHANTAYPAEFIYQNLMIAANIIHQAWLHEVQELLFFGSTCMYPLECLQPMREESLLTGSIESSNEAYALAKLTGWKLCESYNRQYGTKFRTILPSNLYGPHDNFHSQDSHVIPALIQKLHWAKEDQTREVDVWGSGKALREFLYVDDLIEACEYLDTYPEVLGPINVGSRQEVSIRELVEEVKDVVGYSGNVRFDNSKPDGMPIKRVDTSCMDQLGWQSKISLRDGLERTYAWFLQSQQQLRK